MRNAIAPHMIPASCAEVVRAYGSEAHFHLTGTYTDGQYVMFTSVTPPGDGPPPHFHAAEDEWWFVLDGEPEFFDGTSWIPVAAGGAVFMPANSFHTFRNAGDKPLRQIVHTAPSGFEHFLKKSEVEFQNGGAPEMNRILEIGAEFGIYFPTIAPDDASKRCEPLVPPVVVQPDQTKVVRAFGDEGTILLDTEKTGGRLASLIAVTPPGGGPPAHIHQREDEWFYVLEGDVSFMLDGAWSTAQPGDVVFAPRNSVHTFKNNTDRPIRMLIHTAPSGFEKFFEEAAIEFSRSSRPDMSRLSTIAGDYGIHFV